MELDFLTYYTDTPKFTHAPGLAVMSALCARLGNPQRNLRCVHIAGTNGKGSCAAMVDAMLRAAGVRTGLFTSPDLTGPWERMRVNGVSITLPDFARITAQVRQAAQGLAEPSFFEKLTAAAFVWFAEQRCDAVVLEVGLGGRLDATNILEKPAVSVIMPIGLDHTAILGPDLSAIAAEKAGIIKPGCPVVSALQPPEAAEVIRSRCSAVDAPLHEVNITKIRPLSHSPAGQCFDYGDTQDIHLALLGAHQIENACAALETGRILGLSEVSIRAGLANAVWPCRFEYIPGRPAFLLDGAHNPHGAAALAASLRDYFPGRRFTMVMGVMSDKDWRGILALMEPLASEFICLTPEGPRALPAAELAAAIRSVPTAAVDNLDQALALCRTREGPVCAFGSLYYIGYFRKEIMEERQCACKK